MVFRVVTVGGEMKSENMRALTATTAGSSDPKGGARPRTGARAAQG